MKKFIYWILIAFLISFSFSSCKKLKKTDAEFEREKWIAGFNDSINYYKERSRQITDELDKLNSEVADKISQFEMIKKAREVTGYYILKGWGKKVPFTNSGIYARINENENLELIATETGNTFNRISVGEDSEKFYSEIVPHDQAFNYRHERYNTVYFTGGKADTIAQYIAEHSQDKIKLYFIEGGKINDFVLPVDEKENVKKTWDLYYTQRKIKFLQKDLWICSRKIDTFRRILDSDSNDNKQN